MKVETDSFYVYFFYDSKDRLLYIGKTTSVRARMKQHFSRLCVENEPWKNLVDKDKITLYKCNNPTDLDIYEVFFINKYKPLYNKDRVFGYTPSFELPELTPIKPMKTTKILLRLFNEEMDDYFRESFVARFSQSIDEDFCSYNRETNRLEICF
jgi:Nuclease subunit of the excinuclease complex